MSDESKKCSQCHSDLPDGYGTSLCPKCLLKIGFETKPDPGAQEADSYQPRFVPPSVEELSPHFPQLEIIDIVGHGGMGVVYKARQIELDRLVALKILRPSISGDSGFAERFQREARALAKLNHRNIVTVYDFGRKDGLYFFIMEYVDGTNLRHLERTGKLRPKEALEVVPKICDALQYAHDNGVVHRDIKPENILINTDGDVRIADFGLAKLAGTPDDVRLTGTWQVMGTPHYMAPEQFEKPGSVDHRADIYSLGVVIYELLTGELPLGRFPLPSEKVQLDVRLDQVVLRALEKEPDRRYQRATDVATAVDKASTAEGAVRSRIQQASQGVQDAARSLGRQANTLWKRGREWGSKDTLTGLMQWLGSRAGRIGRVLMWCGAADAVLALLLIDDFRVPPQEKVFFVATTFLAGIVAFILGRQLCRGRVSNRFRWIAVFGVLPFFAAVPLLSFGRALLVLFGIVASLSMDSSDVLADLPNSVSNRAVDILRNSRKIATRRVLLLTAFGLVGWCLIWLVSVVLIDFCWYRDHAKWYYHVIDNSAADVVPVSGGYSLHFDASEFGIHDRPQYPQLRQLPRKSISVRLIGTDARRCDLKVDFSTGAVDIWQDEIQVESNLPFSESAIQQWLSLGTGEADLSQRQAEVANLKEVIWLMKSTRGKTGALTAEDAQWAPTLRKAITKLRRDQRIITGGHIPTGSLLDPDLFLTRSPIEPPEAVIRIEPWNLRFWIAIALMAWLIGAARVVRVLYQQLWVPSLFSQQVQDDSYRAGSQWFGTNLKLIAVALSAAVLTIVCFSWGGLLTESRPSGFDATPIPIPNGIIDFTLILLVAICPTIGILALLSRPFLRRFGCWSGKLAATLSVVTPLIGLVTFPTGLAVWVQLTDARIRGLFYRGAANQVETSTVAMDGNPQDEQQ